MPLNTKTRKFSVEEYEKLVETGVLTEEENVELIRGEITEMTPIGRKHADSVNRLNRIFSKELGDQVLVSVQNPLRIEPESEPEPDIVLFEYRDDLYEETHPGPEDVLLIVEVAQTSQELDREQKIPLYAENHVQETWLVDLEEKQIEQFRTPSGDTYKEIRIYEPGDSISPSACSELEMSVNRILP